LSPHSLTLLAANHAINCVLSVPLMSTSSNCSGKTKIHVAGYTFSPNYTRARDVAQLLAQAFPEQFDEVDIKGTDRTQFMAWLAANKVKECGDKPNSRGETAANHVTCPIVWLDKGDEKEFIGGRDRLCEWTVAKFPDSLAATKAQESLCTLL